MQDGLPYLAFDRIRAPRQERSRRAFFAALDAFERLVRERPLAQVTMEQVAAEAGLAITSVYGRFDGKAALVLALHERTIDRALSEMDAFLEAPELAELPVPQLVARAMEGLVRFSEEQAHVFRAVLAAADEETNQRAAAFVRAGSERFARLLLPRLGGSETVERDLDFAWRSAAAVLQQRWFLSGAEPARFPLDGEALAQRLTAAVLAMLPPAASAP